MSDIPEELDVLVVGAGFSGAHQLYHLRKLGYKVKVVETGSSMGGIWYWASYPGARVDSSVPVYELSLDELWKDWNWNERFPSRAEILKYFEYMDKKLDLSKDIYFNSRVISAEFNASTNRWIVRTDNGRVFSAKFLDLCVGFAAKPYEAVYPGVEEYTGKVHHSNNWPQEVDVRGKRVGVIGTGASGVQIIQTVGPQVSHLTVFQRTPNLALHMDNRKYSTEDMAKLKPKYPRIFNRRLETFSGFRYDSVARHTFDDPPEVREAFFEGLWAHGDFHLWLAGYFDGFYDPNANNEIYAFWRKKVRARLTDPVMQDKLAPLVPPHAFGTKRPSMEMNYYEVFNQPNVDLVDINETPIECFTPAGLRTKDGKEHVLDIVVLATGYDAVTGSIYNIDIKGRDGISIKDKWVKDGIQTFLGMTTSGFPNMFFLYNAQAPTAFSNGPSCIEVQGDWIVQCIDYVLKNGKSTIDATLEAEDAYTWQARELFKMTLHKNTASWYQGANIPGKRLEPSSFIGGIPLYRQLLTESRDKGYEGFVIA